MDKELIKEIIKQMIRDEEIVIKVDIERTYSSSDCFGNADGNLHDVGVECWLEVGDE